MLSNPKIFGSIMVARKQKAWISTMRQVQKTEYGTVLAFSNTPLHTTRNKGTLNDYFNFSSRIVR